MAKVVEVYPDKSGTVRNVQVLVKPGQDGSSKYKPSNGYEIKRHVSKLLLLVPAEDQEIVVKNSDVEEKNDVLGSDDQEEMKSFDDDASDSKAQDVGSSFNSPDDEKQDDAKALLVGEVGEVPGGNVVLSRRSPRFGHTSA